MNNKLITVFLILTVIPVSLLSWLTVMSFKSEKDRSLKQFIILCEERLQNVDFQIQSVFSHLENELLQLPDLSAMEVDDIRELTRKSTIIRQVFILSEDNSMRYPSKEIPLSEREQDFLVRTGEIGISTGLFLKPASETSEVYLSRGWYTWYLGSGINFIFWQKYERPGTGKYGIVGIELNRMAVISAVIRELPDTAAVGEQDFLITLNNVNDAVVYQWGGLVPVGPDNAITVLPVSFPLSSWHLKYFAGPDTGTPYRGRILTIFAFISMVIIFIMGLAVYLYRESTREIRDAMHKVSFVNQVSHELKTPLTNIRMYAELLERHIPKDSEKGRNYLDIVVSESRRLSRLITNILTFSKEQKNGIQFNPVRAVPDDIIKSVTESFRPSLKLKKMKCELTLKSNKEVMLDTDILEQILSNLLSNAIKYASSGGFIGIESFPEDETTNIIVRDKGPGIPASLKEKVFKPFYRVSNKLTDGVTGTGIGLSIVRSLSEIHGGSAAIVPSGEGTAVHIILNTPPCIITHKEEQ